MRRISLVLAVGMLCCFYTTVSADIYMWTDENGIKHISNTRPPAGAEILMQTAEIPYDEKADKERKEAEQLEKAIAVRQEILDLEARLFEMQRAADQRIETANQKARDAYEYAEYWKNAAEENYNSFSGSQIRYFGNYPYYPNFKHYQLKRWYYRNKDDIYYDFPHHNYYKDHAKKHHLKGHPDKYHGKRHDIRRHKRIEINNKGYRSRGTGSRYGRLK